MASGLISVLIPVLVILLAVFTKRIIPSLMIGILAGGIALAKGNIIQGVLSASDHLIKATANTESVYIIFFLFIFGAFGEIMKVSGGIKGFTKLSEKFVKTERGALWAVWAVTPFTFIDCCFHVISAGTVGKALIEKVNGNKRKLSFVLNITSCLLIILIPFGTTYVGYIMGVVSSALNRANVSGSAYEIYLKSIPFNFYSIIMILISIGIILFNFGFRKEYQSNQEDDAFEKEHGHDEAHEQCTFEEKAPPRPLNLILPLCTLILTTFFFLWLTGREKGSGFWDALLNANFEESIFVSGLISIVLTSVFYLIQKMPLREIESHFLSGGNEMIPPITVLILSWGLSGIIGDLGFVKFVTNFVSTRIPVYLIPAAIYLIGCFASYFMGSAWGTWALIMPMAVPLAVSSGLDLPLVIGAVLAGGALGDNASPLGETAILSATICDIPVVEHVKSELPYCLTAVGLSSVLFIVFSFI
ncbi:Na+/H+ antiporter NhaC family protein [Caproicibacter sp. BJN0012]|uniref:Na+/H+ antiporter NhaC family protein n=1 Tax=Caproicibacter sp. BJN0012 TaxID=3110227 RepID=UPI002E1368ED|nr:Na+/H+ antiporter NhaC family protein [Caproicibacter sp. BJN0012]